MPDVVSRKREHLLANARAAAVASAEDLVSLRSAPPLSNATLDYYHQRARRGTFASLALGREVVRTTHRSCFCSSPVQCTSSLILSFQVDMPEVVSRKREHLLAHAQRLAAQG